MSLRFDTERDIMNFVKLFFAFISLMCIVIVSGCGAAKESEITVESALPFGTITGILIYTKSQGVIIDPVSLEKAASMINGLTVGKYEPVGKEKSAFSFTVYYGNYTSYKVTIYDSEYIEISSQFTRKITAGEPLALKEFLENNAVQIEDFGLTRQNNLPHDVYYEIKKDRFISEVHEDMTFRELMEHFGVGEYKYDIRNQYHEYALFVEPYKEDLWGLEIKLRFADPCDLVGADGAQIYEIVSGGKWIINFGSIPENSVDQANGKATVLQFNVMNGKTEYQVCDKNLEPIRPERFEQCNLYDNCFIGKSGGKYILYDFSGKELHRGDYFRFNQNEIGIVKKKGVEYYFINEKGERTDNVDYDSLYLNDNGTFDGRKDKEYVCFDSNGKLIFTGEPAGWLKELKNGKVIYHYIKDEKTWENLTNLVESSLRNGIGTTDYNSVIRSNYQFFWNTKTGIYIYENIGFFYRNIVLLPDGGFAMDEVLYSVPPYGAEYNGWKLEKDLGSEISQWLKKNIKYIISVE